MVNNKSQGTQPLSDEEVKKMNAYWRAANYLSVAVPTKSVKSGQLVRVKIAGIHRDGLIGELI